MLKTGRDLAQAQPFHCQLLSEYNADITLDNYVAYFELKPIAKKIEHIRQELERDFKGMYIIGDASVCTSLDGAAAGPPYRSPARQRTGDVSMVLTPTTGVEVGEGNAMSIATFVSGKERSGNAGGAIALSTPCAPQPQGARFAEMRVVDPKLADLLQSRIELQERFFDLLQESYQRVKHCLNKLEFDFTDAAAELRSLSEDHIRSTLPRTYIPSLYVKLEVILRYRALNLIAFLKILKKFLERCACDSLELQKRVLEMDRRISSSNVSHPSIDLRSAAMDLMAVYGTVFRLTYEETAEHMKQYEHRTGINAQRILPNSQTFFVVDAFPHHEQPGHFAARVLAGTCSLFCEKAITRVLQCPRYPGRSCGRFSNGEVSVSLQGPVRGDDVFIVQSLVAMESENLSNSTALMELLLLIHSVQLAAASRITAVIPYLAYTRNVASISAVAEMIESTGCQHVITVDMHSDQVEGMFSIPMESISAMYEFVRYISEMLKNEGNAMEVITVVAATGELLGRAKEYADALMRYNQLDSATHFVSVCTAVQRVETLQSANPSRGFRPEDASQWIEAASVERHRDAHASAGDLEPFARRLPCPPNTHLLQSVECATPTGSSSVATSQLVADTPVGGNGAAYPYSPATSDPSDAIMAELIAVTNASPTIAMAGGQRGGPAGEAAAVREQSSGMAMQHAFEREITRSTSSTYGIERALRQQEEGRHAIVKEKREKERHDQRNYVLVGDVKERLCIIIETVVDEAVNITQVARCLHEKGAQRIILVATHAVLSGKAVERLVDSPIELVVVTDSVNQEEAMKNPKLARKLRVVPIAPLLARAIEKIHTENTLATLFDKS